MTQQKIIEAAKRKALDLVKQEAARWDYHGGTTYSHHAINALARHIQTTSDNARAALAGYNDAYCPATHLETHLKPLILPSEPDPLEEAMAEAWPFMKFKPGQADKLRAEIERRGGKITFE